MLRQTRTLLLILAAIVLLFVFAPAGQVASQQIDRVFVTNLPRIQQIEGEVTVEGPVHLATLVAFEEITVAPVEPTETTRLIDAGTLVTDGFPSVVLSLDGVVKGTVQKTGRVGAILVPDVESVQEAFDQRGLMHFALEATAGAISSKTPYFASAQPRHRVAFPSYRVLLYNTTDKAVDVNLYAYLTN